MPSEKPKRGRRSQSMRIIEAGEEQIGLHGPERVSMRQIVAAAGQANPSAIQYHFKSIEGLIDAIYQRRFPALEARRAELLARLDENGRKDIEKLLDATMRPLMEMKNTDGRRGFARFVVQMTFGGGLPSVYRDLVAENSPTLALVALIHAVMPGSSMEFKRLKLAMVFQWIIRIIIGMDEAEHSRWSDLNCDKVLAFTISMAAAALRDPTEIDMQPDQLMPAK